MKTSSLRHLPRDARDTLLLLAVIAWTLLPHAFHLPWWCIALTAMLLVWRASLALDANRLPSTAVRTGLLALTVALTWWSYGTVIGKDPGVTLLVMLVVIKTLELRARRDALVIFFLGFFLIVTNFFYSQSLPVAAAMLLSVWGLLTALVLANIPAGKPSIRQASAIAARTAAWSLPLMAVMFMLFPRLGPLWGADQSGRATTGLSNTLRMGGIAELVNNDQIAFRIRFDGPAPDASALYFRGPVLSHFDGSEWRRKRPGSVRAAEPEEGAPPEATTPATFAGQALAYELALEPLSLNVVPSLEWTSDLALASNNPAARDTPRLQTDMMWSVERPLSDRAIFKGIARSQLTLGPFRPDATVAEALTIPEASNPRTIEWALALVAADPQLASAGTDALVKRLLKHINTGYTYSMAPGVYGDARGRFAIDEFWLDRREGFCEHFATAMVYILRSLGTPARVVTGYQGADATLQDGWHVVRQLNAHAWVEVWTSARGWTRVDPTAAVAPERVMNGRTLRRNQGFMSQALEAINPSLLPNIRALWETTQLRWNQWVVQYSRGQQFDLLKRLGIDTPRWEHLIYGVIGLLVTTSLAGALWAWWDRRRRDPWERLQSDVRERLRMLGVLAAPHEAPRTMAKRVRDELGAEGWPIAQLLLDLDRERYAISSGATARVQPSRRASDVRANRESTRTPAPPPLQRPNPSWWRAFAKATSAASRRATVSAFSNSMFHR